MESELSHPSVDVQEDILKMEHHLIAPVNLKFNLEYYEEIQTQTGFLELICDDEFYFPDIFYDRPYNSIPSVNLILQGASANYD